MQYSIRSRIAWPYILLILVVVAALGAYFSYVVQSSGIEALEAETAAQARLTAAAVAPMLSAGTSPEQLDRLAKEWGEALGKRVTLIDPQGVVLGESDGDRLSMENHGGRPEVVQARLSGQGVDVRPSETLGEEMLYVAVPVHAGQQLLGYSRIAMPLEAIRSAQNRLRRALVLTAAAAALAAAALAAWIAGRTTQPLRRLAEAAEAAARGRLDTRLIPTTQDEIGRLTEKFNEMTARLGEQISQSGAERSRIEAVLQAMSDGVLMIDAAGKVQLLNAAAETMFDLKTEQAVGHSLIETLRHHQILELWEACVRSGEIQSAVVEIPSRRLYLQCSAAPLGSALPGNILLLFQDLTRMRRLETVRRDFVSNISHELRTPLASLKALTETLQEGALDDPPAARGFLARIETEVDALSQMVEELLELTRIESGRVPLQFAPVSPLNLIQAAVERLKLQGERAGIEISIDCPPDLPAVQADARRLEQVIVNLLHNAIKFTPTGGHIFLAAHREGEQIEFTVRDTGVGIPEDDLPRIFERFFKTDRARSSGGTGLGLAIARHLVEAHGGHIHAESVEGRGSTFTFTIPVS